jgi:hypothetical protein
MHIVPGSYKPLGNSGTCYNQSITACDAVQTPFSVLRSLYFMSDHLPITLTLAPGSGVGITEADHTLHMSLTLQQRTVRIAGGQGPAVLCVQDASGRLLFQHAMVLQRTYVQLQLPATIRGFVVANVRDTEGAVAVGRAFVE